MFIRGDKLTIFLVKPPVGKRGLLELDGAVLFLHFRAQSDFPENSLNEILSVRICLELFVKLRILVA